MVYCLMTLAKVYTQLRSLTLFLSMFKLVCLNKFVTFKHTNLNIAFQTTNTIYNQLWDKVPKNKINSSGIYRLKWKASISSYVGQTSRSVGILHWEHTRYIKTNNPISACALHILNNRHECGNSDQTMELLKTCNKGMKMKCWESKYEERRPTRCNN